MRESLKKCLVNADFVLFWLLRSSLPLGVEWLVTFTSLRARFPSGYKLAGMNSDLFFYGSGFFVNFKRNRFLA